MPLRDYQLEALANVKAAIDEGVNRQLIVMPTGCGKTECFAKIPETIDLQPGEQMHVIVQREELCFQAHNKLQLRNPDLKVGIEKADFKTDADCDLTIMSIQTVGKGKKDDNGDIEPSGRLKKFDPSRCRAVIGDEGHHFLAEQYWGTLKYFSVFKPDFRYDDPSKLLLLVTATPNRADNKGMETLVDRIVFGNLPGQDLLGFIRKGWLADIRAFQIQTTVNIEAVSVRQGDFATKELERAVNTEARNKLVVEKYKELGEGMPAIGFTVDIQHSEDAAKAFNDAGITAYAISSRTPERDRRKIIQMYAEGSVKVILSCNALLEGFDSPRASVALWMRPTKSQLLYAQGIGRVLRPFPAPEESDGWNGFRKPYAMVLDFVDISGKHRLTTVPSLFGLSPTLNAKGQKMVEVVDELEKLQAKAPGVNLSPYSDLESVRGVVEKIDLLAKPTIPDEIRKFSKLAWVTGMTAGAYQLCLPDKGMLSIKVNTLGQYDVFKHTNGVRSQLSLARDLGEALKIADRNVPREAAMMLSNDAKWRYDLPGREKQLPYFMKLYPEIRGPFPSDEAFFMAMESRYTKGEISTLISQRSKR